VQCDLTKQITLEEGIGYKSLCQSFIKEILVSGLWSN